MKSAANDASEPGWPAAETSGPATPGRPSPSGQPPSAAGEAIDGRTTRWETHRINRRKELVRQCLGAVTALGPDASMDDLAEYLGTSKSILYRYFTDRSGLQRAVGEAVVQRMKKDLAEASLSVRGPRPRILAMVDLYLTTIDNAPDVYTFVTFTDAVAGHVRGLSDDVAAIVAQTILPDMTPGGGDASDPWSAVRADLWSAGVVGTVRAVGERWLVARQKASATGRPPHTDAAASDIDTAIANLDRATVANLLASWLWDGAAGVMRRGRNSPQPRQTNPEEGT